MCVIAPVNVLHASVVHALSSLMFTAVWNTPVAGTQPSVVQALPSSVLIALCEITPVEELQTSVVQRLLSLVFTGV